MTYLFLFAIVILLLIVLSFYWHQFRVQDEMEEESPEDQRVSPLLKGINYLLSDKPDRALQEMVKVARLNSEAVEVYMSLGEMFRQSGEIGRAVRIHQNILARPDASKEVYINAQYALAKDFQTGGLVDRALKHYQKVLDVDSMHVKALEASLRIREQSHEWQEAETILSRIERIKGKDDSLHRAYLLSEIAQDTLDRVIQAALSDSNTEIAEATLDRAEEIARQALELNSGCVHAYDILIRIMMMQNHDDSVEKLLLGLVRMDAKRVPMLVPALLKDIEIGKQVVVELWEQTKDQELAITTIEHIAREQGAEQARQWQDEILNYQPESLSEWLRLTALGLHGEPAMIDMAKTWRIKMKRFECDHCGVKVVDTRWQCPQCHTWGSMSLIRDKAEELIK